MQPATLVVLFCLGDFLNFLVSLCRGLSGTLIKCSNLLKLDFMINVRYVQIVYTLRFSVPTPRPDLLYDILKFNPRKQVKKWENANRLIVLLSNLG